MMKKLTYEYKCECGRGRCGVPKVDMVNGPTHPCPDLTFGRTLDLINSDGCNCCKSCTIMCLLMKEVRDRKDPHNIFGCFDREVPNAGD